MTVLSKPAVAAVGPLRELDWTDGTTASASSHTVLHWLTRNSSRVLLALLDQLEQRPELHGLCEHLDFMDKLVLWTAPEGSSRLRLHVFRPGYVDWPHNHRFDFVSRILSGRYLHRIYPEAVLTSKSSPAQWTPLMTRVERPGSEYLLQHDAVHAVTATTTTISVAVRGPIVKQRAIVLNGQTGARVDLLGADDEPADVRRRKRMSRTLRAQVAAEVRERLAAESSAGPPSAVAR
jgi:predicted metal-dependent enzyme (double-stranded beta helix superfamily)